MATIKRSLSSKIDASGRSEIFLRLSIGNAFKIRLHSGLFVKPENFTDGTLSKGRPGSPLFGELNQVRKLLTRMEENLFDICQTFPEEDLSREYLQECLDGFRVDYAERFSFSVGGNVVKPISAREVVPPKAQHAKEVKRPEQKAQPEVKHIDLFEAFKKFSDSKRVSEWRKKRYEVLSRALQRFELYRKETKAKSYELWLDTFTLDDLNDFEKYLRSEDVIYDQYPEIFKKVSYDTHKHRKKSRPRKKGENTIISLFCVLKAFFKDSLEQGLITNQPFHRYQGATVERYGTPYYISLQERDAIANFDFSLDKSLETQRDIFIFHTLVGCRVSDLMRLTHDDVINGAIEYIAHKTMKGHPNVIRVPLNQRGLELIAKYKGVDPDGRLFPFIAPQKYNNAIKKIFKEVGITRMVTVLNSTTGEEEKRHINEIASSHLARRTFIGNLYKKVKDPNLIGAMSGHVEGSKAFTRYRTIDEDIKKELISFLD